MSTNEVLLYALANADDDRYEHEGGYAIIHGAQPIPDLPGASKSFNALLEHIQHCGLMDEDCTMKIGLER
jgi:hypothetical protein